jgi:hypothetical protein
MVPSVSSSHSQEVYKVSEAGSIQRGQSDIPNFATVYGFTADSTVKTLPFSTYVSDRRR